MTSTSDQHFALCPRQAFSRLLRRCWLPVAMGLLTQAGCTSAITTAAMREAFRETVVSLAKPLPHAAKDDPADEKNREPDEAAEMPEVVGADAAKEEPAIAAKPTLSLDEAVERAVNRLSTAGQLDAATQATLLAMLESTNPEDWPAAIDAFTASLEANRRPLPPAPPSPPAPSPPPVPSPDEAVSQAKPSAADVSFTSTAAPARVSLESAVALIEPVANFSSDRKKSQPPARPAMLLPEPRAQAMLLPEPRAEVILFPEPRAEALPVLIQPEPTARGGEQKVAEKSTGEQVASVQTSVSEDPADEPVRPPLAVRNPCFVTRVKAWGVVDRFPTQIFRCGQDVIVYFELEHLSCRSSSTGHSTSIDTAFRLVGADGAPINSWTFEPVDETCLSPRRDYFARYFLRIPENTPAGPCRLEFVVTDRLAGSSTQAHLDLEITDRP